MARNRIPLTVAMMMGRLAWSSRPERSTVHLAILDHEAGSSACGLDVFSDVDSKASLGELKNVFQAKCEATYPEGFCTAAISDLWEGQDLIANLDSTSSDFCARLRRAVDAAERSGLVGQYVEIAGVDAAVSGKVAGDSELDEGEDAGGDDGSELDEGEDAGGDDGSVEAAGWGILDPGEYEKVYDNGISLWAYNHPQVDTSKCGDSDDTDESAIGSYSWCEEARLYLRKQGLNAFNQWDKVYKVRNGKHLPLGCCARKVRAEGTTWWRFYWNPGKRGFRRDNRRSYLVCPPNAVPQ